MSRADAFGKAVKRSPAASYKGFQPWRKLSRPKPDHRLALHDRRALTRKRFSEVGRQVGHIAAGAEDVGKSTLGGMMQRRVQSAKRTKSGRRTVWQARETFFFPPAYDQLVALDAEPVIDKVEQAKTVVARMRLVTAETARLSAGENDTEDFQSNASVAWP